MRNNERAESCEIVGLFLLYSLRETFNKDDIGLHRDDGLACFLKKINGHQTDKIRKELIKIFQAHGLKLEIKCSFKKANVQVDITFDLNTGSYSPYRKPKISKNLARRLMES